MLPSHRGRDTPIRSEGSDDYPSAALSVLSRDGYRPAWQVAGGQATLSVLAVPRGGRAHVSSGVCLRRSVSCHQATNRGYGHERQWHSRYGAGVTHQPDHSHKRMKKKHLSSSTCIRQCYSTSTPSTWRLRSAAPRRWPTAEG